MSTSHKILLVAGARPNFMKIAPLLRAFRRFPRVQPLLVHTGQHYDFHMSEIFFKDLRIPRPDIYLNVGSGSHALQTSRILAAFEEVLMKEKPRLVIVVGDVNSAMACALAAAKMHIPVAHVEAGLRSFDRHMPEETNRVITDRLSDFLFVSEESGLRNLRKEGAAPRKIFHAGNVMIDSLVGNLAAVRRSAALKRLGLEGKDYAVLTLHRPSNVDTPESLSAILGILKEVSASLRLVFPMHPRTERMILAHGMKKDFRALKSLQTTGPMGYTDFLRLVQGSRFALTDSGGIQEETTYLKVPCMTMRLNTERPATLDPGTNRLVGTDKKKIMAGVRLALAGDWKKSGIPKYWDGKAAQRIARTLVRTF